MVTKVGASWVFGYLARKDIINLDKLGKTMNDDEQRIEAIKKYQLLLETIHPLVEKELVRLALCLFRDARSCRIEVMLPDDVKVYMRPYTGFRAFVNKWIKHYDTYHPKAARDLVKGIEFWLPHDKKTGKKPRISVFWE